jgi:hypothetical protein
MKTDSSYSKYVTYTTLDSVLECSNQMVQTSSVFDSYTLLVVKACITILTVTIPHPKVKGNMSSRVFAFITFVNIMLGSLNVIRPS